MENSERTPLLAHGYNEGSRLSRINLRRMFNNRIPVLGWLPTYSLGFFAQDLLAGFTVGLTEIPQGIAYALVAGLPSQYGLYSGFMGCLVYFIFGTCKDINVGPTAIMALMVQSHVSVLGPAGAILMAFLSGCIIFLAGLFRLGFLVDFFSYPVIAGFTSAAALNIASSQLKSLLGITGKSETFLEAWIAVFQRINETKKWDLILGVITMASLFFGKEIRRYGTLNGRPEWSKTRNFIGRCIFMFSLARNAIAVVIGTCISYSLEIKGINPFTLTGNVVGGLPPFSLPPFGTTFNGTHYSFTDMMTQYGTLIVFCPLITILEHVAIAKAFSKGKTIDATQELIALGLSNIFGSFVSSMPVTGSFTRTAVNNASGVKTTAGGIVTAIIVLLALGFLTEAFKYIPKATLAAVIIVAMFYLCKFKAFAVLWRTKKVDVIPLTVTLVTCLLLSLEYGILIGIAVNSTFILYANSRPKLDVEIVKYPKAEVSLFKPKLDLNFTSAEYVRERILKSSKEDSIVIIDGKHVGNIDATAAGSLIMLGEDLDMRKQRLVLWNFKDSVKEVCINMNKHSGKYFTDSASMDDILDEPLALGSSTLNGDIV